MRVTAYLIANGVPAVEKMDAGHLDALTDIIMIGGFARFDANGSVCLSKDFAETVAALKEKIGKREIRIHLSLAGPNGQGRETEYESMYSKGEEHRKAFESGRLEKDIAARLEKYELDGVFFDYEYPMAEVHKDAFSAFLVSLKRVLGDRYVLGAAEYADHAELSREAIRALDRVEVMCYDVWDEKGFHSSLETTRDIMEDMIRLGYTRAQMDVGIPFYARPTTRDAFWYDYRDYYDRIDAQGLVRDEKTGLTASFNTPDLVYRKTRWAEREGFGGIMVWNYHCDIDSGDSRSLWNAVKRAVQEGKAGK